MWTRYAWWTAPPEWPAGVSGPRKSGTISSWSGVAWPIPPWTTSCGITLIRFVGWCFVWHTFGHDYLDGERGSCPMKTLWNTVWSNGRNKAFSLCFLYSGVRLRVEGNRESTYCAHCFTQCFNGCSLGSLLFPRQDIHVQRCLWCIFVTVDHPLEWMRARAPFFSPEISPTFNTARAKNLSRPPRFNGSECNNLFVTTAFWKMLR